jgi:hypothetical protein
MLFMCHGRPRENLSEAEVQRALRVFSSWTPPAGVEIRAHYAAASGGDFVVIETDSAAALLEAASVWRPFLHYTFEPIVPVSEGASAIGKATEALALID